MLTTPPSSTATSGMLASPTVETVIAPVAPKDVSVALSAEPVPVVSSSPPPTSSSSVATSAASTTTVSSRSTPAVFQGASGIAVPPAIHKTALTRRYFPLNPLPRITFLEDEIQALEKLLNEEYTGNRLVISITRNMIAAIRKENKMYPTLSHWDGIRRIQMTHDLLAGVLSPELVQQYHADALALSGKKQSKTKQIIGGCMIALAVALVAAAVVVVPFLSLAIAGVAALSTTIATAMAATPFGVGAATSAFGGCLLFRKPPIARHMLALEQVKIDNREIAANSVSAKP